MIKWICVFLLLNNSLFSQSINFIGDSKSPIMISEGFRLKNSINTHQYLLPKWHSGILYYRNGTSKPYDSLNFERYANNLEVVSNNKILALLPLGLSGAIIKKGASNFILYVAKIKTKSRFIIIESYGHFLLGSYLSVDEPPENHNYVDGEVRFIAKKVPDLVFDKKFVVLKEGSWNAFKLNKLSVIKLFGIGKREAHKIAEEEQFLLSDKAGLLELFQFLNK